MANSPSLGSMGRDAVASNPREAAKTPFQVVLTGNPNSGKTTVFNALTGLRARVGNYAGVTVERKEGRLQGVGGEGIIVLDLPGTYSLTPQSLDEQIARDVLLERAPGVPPPSLVVVVVDASNLERNLYFATQVAELGHPTILALNMVDVADQNGHKIDAAALSAALGIPVVAMVASTGQGIKELRNHIIDYARTRDGRWIAGSFCVLQPAFEKEIDALAASLEEHSKVRQASARAEALLLIMDEKRGGARGDVLAARGRLEQGGLDWRSAPIEARYARVAAIQQAVTAEEIGASSETLSDRLDRIVTHKVWGLLIFIAIMAVMFLTIFTLAKLPMNMLQSIFDFAGNTVDKFMPPGELRSLLVKGMIGGVGAVVVFLPQICLLFMFIGLLEDTGYMARAAFLMDRLMSKVGLHGKSFIPMLSSFACAIPGIMATRTIETPKDRLVTILVAPLMSCSARLPVYTLLIAACLSGSAVTQSVTMLCMYLLGIVVALGMAWIFKKTLLKGETPMLVMELPPYKRPLLRIVLRHMWDRSKLFLRRAGTVILGINILLWFLATHPTHRPQAGESETAAAGEQLRHSYAGQAGHAIEPIIAPLGFDWKMGIGIVSSFAAREVFVSTMAIVYNVAEGHDEASQSRNLSQVMREQKRPDGSTIYTPLTAITLMVFYVLALQCVSTVAIVQRETNSWKWPVFQWVYMGVLAWVFAFVTWHGGHLLGFK